LFPVKERTVMLKYLFRYKFSIILAAIISLLSLIPSSSLPDSSLFAIPFFDKFVHFCMYVTIGFVSLLETRCTQICHRRQFLLLLTLFLMGLLIEVLQATVVPSRSAEWFDLLANFCGLVAGYLTYRLLRYKNFFNLFRS
jgi:VanZ family protein